MSERAEPFRCVVAHYGPWARECWFGEQGIPEPGERIAVREDCITLSDRESAAKVISRARDQGAWERLPQYVKDACRAEADSILSTIFKDGQRSA